MGSQSSLAIARQEVVDVYNEIGADPPRFLAALQHYESMLGEYMLREAIGEIEQIGQEQVLHFVLTEKEREDGGYGCYAESLRPEVHGPDVPLSGR